MAAKKYGTWVLTDSSKPDRHGTTIDVASLDISAFERNPIVTMGHDDARPIGYSANLLKDNGRLIFDLMIDREASPEAGEAARLIEAGVLRACSAEFIGRADQNGLFKNAELVAASIVSIPSNPRAVRIRSNEADTQILITEQIPMTEAVTETQTQETTPPMETRSAPLTPSGNATPLAPAVHTKRHAYNLRRVLRAQIDQEPLDGLEKECHIEIRNKQEDWRDFDSGYIVPAAVMGLNKRANATTSGANMAPLTGEESISSILALADDGIQDETLMDRLPITRYSGLTEAKVRVEKQTGMLSAGHVLLDADLPSSSDPAFAITELTPKVVGSISQLNKSAITARHPRVGTTDFIAQELRRALVAEVERVFLIGDNTSNPEESDGLLLGGTATSLTVAAANAVDNFAGIRKTLRDYMKGSNQGGSWILHPDIVDEFLTVAAFSGATASAYEALGLGKGTLLNDPLYLSTSIAKTATSPGFYLKPETVIHGTWEGVNISVNPWHSDVYAKQAVLVRCSLLHDIKIVDAKKVRSFSYDLS